jgi:hypothetical protein
MSWTPNQQSNWQSLRNNIEARFQTVKDQYIDSAQRTPDDMIKLNFLEGQMSSAREELSRLIVVVKDSLEDVRGRTGNLEQPIIDLEKQLERLTIELTNLQRRKLTREEQVVALSRRTEENTHTIGFLMIRPLQHPTSVIIVTTLLVATAFYLNFTMIRSFLISIGFVQSTMLFSRASVGIPSFMSSSAGSTGRIIAT